VECSICGFAAREGCLRKLGFRVDNISDKIAVSLVGAPDVMVSARTTAGLRKKSDGEKGVGDIEHEKYRSRKSQVETFSLHLHGHKPND
jgi:hypothetical protein